MLFFESGKHGVGLIPVSQVVEVEGVVIVLQFVDECLVGFLQLAEGLIDGNGFVFSLDLYLVQFAVDEVIAGQFTGAGADDQADSVVFGGAFKT